MWVETPSNPSLSIIDIAATAAYVHQRGATLVVDNTFATPYLQNPLALGADVVVHSTTKYLGGHSDVVGGLVALNDAAVADRVAFLQNATGAVPGPWDCYLIQRGAKTLALRMDRHCTQRRKRSPNSWTATSWWRRPTTRGWPPIPATRWPAGRCGASAASCHSCTPGARPRPWSMAARTKVFTLAESLGAVESLIEHPGRMTHAVLAQSPLAVDPALIRLSVGIENIDDLLTDLDHALKG